MEDLQMNIKLKNKLKKILSSVMAAGMSMSLIPSVSFAAQSNEYVDPADVWIEANGRASEFDINATVTTGTIFCPICDMPTTNISYRVPEYTRTGETAMNRGVYYSDGTCIDGVSKGNLETEHRALTHFIPAIIGQNQFAKTAVQ